MSPSKRTSLALYLLPAKTDALPCYICGEIREWLHSYIDGRVRVLCLSCHADECALCSRQPKEKI